MTTSREHTVSGHHRLASETLYEWRFAGEPLVAFVDPEILSERVQLRQRFLFKFNGEEGSKYYYKRAIIGPPAKRHL